MAKAVLRMRRANSPDVEFVLHFREHENASQSYRGIVSQIASWDGVVIPNTASNRPDGQFLG